MQMDFTAIDVETANSKRGSICAVGLSRVRNGQIMLSSSWLVDPPGGRIFDGANVREHGIKEHDMHAAITWEEALARITDFIQDDIIAHHGAFDMQALAQACHFSGLQVPLLTSIDTLVLARALLPNQKHGLQDVSMSLGMPPFQHHDAEADAIACAGVLIRLAKRHGGFARLRASHPEAENRLSAQGSISLTNYGLPPWIKENVEAHPYARENHNAWLDLVLAHPAGRAVEGTPCIGCGTPIDKRTNYKYKNRHCCVKCSDKFKRRAIKYADWLRSEPKV